MTQEEKAQRYDEALVWMRDLYPTMEGAIKEDAEHYFPELKEESEDERIRKALIENFKWYCGDFPETTKWGKDDNLLVKDIIAWLEKQGNKAECSIYNIPSREVILAIWDLGNEWKELTNGSISTEYGTQLDYIQKHWHESEYYLRAKQGEQKPYGQRQECFDCQFNYAGECKGSCDMKRYELKPDDTVEPKFDIGDKIQYSKGCGTIMTIEKIENGEYIFSNNMGHTTIESGNKWHLVEQKPAWSEEDDYNVERLLCLLTNEQDNYSQLSCDFQDIEEIKDWLKFLKDRRTWFPSDEQIKALDNAIAVCSERDYETECRLDNLRQDLKKLMKE